MTDTILYKNIDYIREAIDNDVSQKTLAEKFGVTTYRLNKFIHANKLKRRKGNKTKRQELVDENIDEIKKMLDSQMNATQIAKHFGFKSHDIYSAIKRHSIDVNLLKMIGKGESYRAGNEKRRKLKDEDLDNIKKLYFEENLFMHEIAKKYNVSTALICYFLKKHNIKARTLSEANTLLYEKRPELREIHRENVYNGVTGYPGGKRQSWIELYCQEWLEKNGIVYEPEYRIDNYGHSYDFRVDNILIEMDGVYWHNKEEQIKKDKLFEVIANENGFIVIRITDEEIREHGDAIMNEKLGCLL